MVGRTTTRNGDGCDDNYEGDCVSSATSTTRIPTCKMVRDFKKLQTEDPCSTPSR
jgi:hypothetical protein